MTRFVTVDGLKDRIGAAELLQVAGIGRERHEDGRQLDITKINEAIAFAEELVIAKVRERYKSISELTPETTPALLQGYVDDIVRYRLRVRSNNQNQVTDELRNRFKDAKEFLEDVQQGRASLDLPSDPRGSETRHFGIGCDIPEDRSQEILAGYML